MDFENLNAIWKLKGFCISCIELIFKFLSQLSYAFSLTFSLLLIFRCIILKILFIEGHSSTFGLFDGKV